MKKIKLTILTILISTLGFAQSKNAKENLVVDGVCKMCKKRIEKVCLKTNGVKSASWNIETHNLSLIIDQTKVQLDEIKSNIAKAGHDTVDVKASDESYSLLDPCCKYRDTEVMDNHKK
jgi:cation transport ATPase